MKIKLDPGAYMPTRAHSTDAGLDLYSPVDVIVRARQIIWRETFSTRELSTKYIDNAATIDTGVHIAIPEGYVGFLKSKSGLNVKHGITSEGVIDAGYTGSIIVKLYNNSDKDYTIHKGDKISQLVILPIITPELEVVDELDDTERGDGGFGSTGK